MTYEEKLEEAVREVRDRSEPFKSITMSEDVLQALADEEGADPRRRNGGSLHGLSIKVIPQRKTPYLNFLT